MEVVDSVSIDKFFYRVCWYHKILKKIYSGSWHKFNIEKENNEWLMKQNKKYPDCHYWLEGYILKPGENYDDLMQRENDVFKNIEVFLIKQNVMKVIDISSNVLDTFVYLNNE